MCTTVAGVNTPTLIVVAQADDITMWDHEIEAFNQIPCQKKKLEILPKTSHMTLYATRSSPDPSSDAVV